MHNTENEATILEYLEQLETFVGTLANPHLAAELKARIAALRSFVITPGVPFENPAQ